MSNDQQQQQQQPEVPPFIYHPAKFTEYWFKRHDLKVLPNGAIEGARRPQVVRQMWLGYMELAVPKRYFTKTDIADAVAEYCDRYKQAALIELQAQFKCEFEDLAPLRAWIRAVTGEERPLDVAVWAHTLCNLKRKLFGLESYWEMMPVLIGPQGSGKSRAIQRLLSPIDHMALFYDVDQATDTAVAINYSTHLACFFDELSRGAKADIEYIKKLITQPKFSTRLMYENETGSFDQKCTFFGASNKSVSETFFDPTGARRFYDTQSCERTNREIINKLDYNLLFKGIDEKRGVDDSYIDPFETELRAAQTELIPEDVFQTFVEEMGWEPGDDLKNDGSEFLSMGDIIERYWNPFAERNNLRKYESSVVGRKLKALGFKPSLIRKTGQRGRYVRRTNRVTHTAPGLKVLK